MKRAYSFLNKAFDYKHGKIFVCDHMGMCDGSAFYKCVVVKQLDDGSKIGQTVLVRYQVLRLIANRKAA